MKTARLKIWIKGKPVLQGKYYERDGKPVFLCNIDRNKLWTTYNGYSIANQILEAFSKLKIRPLILYKYAERNLVYQATPSDFYRHGIQVDYGHHRQLILPVSKWKFFKEDLKEPFNLPAMTLDEWTKKEEKRIEDLSIPFSVLGELKKRNPDLVTSLRG